MTIEEAAGSIRPLDTKAMEEAWKHWDGIAKPLRSFGKLEKAVVQIAGITGTPDVRLPKKGLVIMCADNGVVEEGVTQSGQEVTAVVAEKFSGYKVLRIHYVQAYGYGDFSGRYRHGVDTPRVEKRKSGLRHEKSGQRKGNDQTGSSGGG